MKTKSIIIAGIFIALLFLSLSFVLSLDDSYNNANIEDNISSNSSITSNVLLNPEGMQSFSSALLDKENPNVEIDKAVSDKAAEFPDEEQTVIIAFEEGKKPEKYKDYIASLGGKVKYDYSVVSAAAVILKNKDIEKLRRLKGLVRVEYNEVSQVFLAESAPIIGANQVWAMKDLNNLNITGKGQTICIIDTGVNYTHPNLAHAYLGGWDFVNNDSDPYDDYYHGTHVAGIIVSNDITYRGIAPDAKFFMIKVCNATGANTYDNRLAGIDWCVNNSNKYNISIISMSLGGLSKRTSPCNTQTDSKAVNRAASLGIFVAIASGNDAWSNGITQPACSSNVTSVGATWDYTSGQWFHWGGTTNCTDGPKTDRITCFTNRASFLSILAPGATITSTWIRGGFQILMGTSMSTPMVAGVAALMRQANNTLTPLEIRTIMQNTGVRIVDNVSNSTNDAPGSGFTFSRINATAAVLAVMPKAVINYTLNVAKIGTGSGIVTGQGINCGTDCFKSYINGTILNLTATPDSNSLFIGWSEACSGTGNCLVTIDSNKSVTANFSLINIQPNSSIYGSGVLMYSGGRDTITLNVISNLTGLKSKKITILRLSPRQSIVASNVTKFQKNGSETTIEGKAVIGIMQTNRDIKMIIREQSPKDYVYYKVSYNDVTEIEVSGNLSAGNYLAS